MTSKKPVVRTFGPEKVGPKLRRYMLAKAWDEIIAETREKEGVGG